MNYDNYKFERRNREYEIAWEDDHLSDCKTVKSYKMSPEEIEARYGNLKGGPKVSTLAKEMVNPKLRVRSEDVMMTRDEVVTGIKKLMDEQGIIDHLPKSTEIAKQSKALEKALYHHFPGGSNAIAQEIGVQTYAAWSWAQKNAEKNSDTRAGKAKKKTSKKIEPIVDVPEEQFQEAYAAAHPEPEVMTVTADAPVESIDPVYTAENIVTEVAEPEVMTELKSNDAIFDTYSHKVADYEKLALNIIDCMMIEQELRQRQEELNIWLEGFEKAAELLGVDLG